MSDVSKAVSRRQFIKKTSFTILVAGGALAVGKIVVSPPNMGLADPYPQVPGSKPAIPPYNKEARFFDEHQYALVANLAAIIIPTDDDPGATEAKVVDYIDSIVADSDKKQSAYIKGLKWIDNLSRKEYGSENKFSNLNMRQQIDLLRLIDETHHMRHRKVSGFIQRFNRKIDKTWDDIFGLGPNSQFFRTIRQDVCEGYFSSPVAWQWVGYYGPPQPNGYQNFSEPPSSVKYIDSMRPVRNSTCLACHETGEHPRDGLIKHGCTSCHRPHSPWPANSDDFHLENHVKVFFPRPD